MSAARFAVMAILRVICRGGINAARCSRADITIYRQNRRGRIYASPTNLPEISHHHGIWRQQNSSPRAIIPANQTDGQTLRASNARPYKPTRKFVVSHISRAGRAPPLRSTYGIHVAAKRPVGIGIFFKTRPRGGRTLFIIYYLLFLIYYFNFCSQFPRFVLS